MVSLFAGENTCSYATHVSFLPKPVEEPFANKVPREDRVRSGRGVDVCHIISDKSFPVFGGATEHGFFPLHRVRANPIADYIILLLFADRLSVRHEVITMQLSMALQADILVCIARMVSDHLVMLTHIALPNL